MPAIDVVFYKDVKSSLSWSGCKSSGGRIDRGTQKSQADLGRKLGVSRAKVTQMKSFRC